MWTCWDYAKWCGLCLNTLARICVAFFFLISQMWRSHNSANTRAKREGITLIALPPKPGLTPTSAVWNHYSRNVHLCRYCKIDWQDMEYFEIRIFRPQKCACLMRLSCPNMVQRDLYACFRCSYSYLRKLNVFIMFIFHIYRKFKLKIEYHLMRLSVDLWFLFTKFASKC